MSQTNSARSKTSQPNARKRGRARKQKPKPARLARGKAKERIPEIMAAAMAVFAEHGFLGASMDDIAARVGVTKPIIYRHFRSKQALLEALLDRELAPDFMQTVPMIRQYAGPLKPLLQLLIARIDPTLPSRQSTIPIFRFILSEGHRTPKIAQKVFRTTLRPNTEAVAEVFARAMSEGKMRKASAEFAARELFAPYMHMMVVLTLMGRAQYEPWQARNYLNHGLESFMRSYEIAD